MKIKKIALLLGLTLCSQAFAEKIQSISIINNNKVEQSTIQKYLGIKIGDEFSEDLRNNGLKNLYKTLMFQHIEIYFRSGNLTVDVREVPILGSIIFEGNTKIKKDVLEDISGIKTGDFLTKAKLDDAIDRIRSAYKQSGRFLIDIQTKIKDMPNGRIKLVVSIAEGPKTPVRKITFVGNQNCSDYELKGVIETKEKGLFSFLSTADTYDPRKIDFDKEVLEAYYKSIGFADFAVISVNVIASPKRDYFDIVYNIMEGPRYNIAEASIQSHIDEVKAENFLKFIKIKPGSTFNMELVNYAASKMTEQLGVLGYPNVVVNPDIQRDFQNRSIKVVFVIEKAPKVFVHQINISGNLKTRDSVIRRELDINEGDLLNMAKIREARRRLLNLDYFRKLEMNTNPEPGTTNQYNIDIDLEEKSTASVNFKVGYGGATGLFGEVSFAERNLAGTGNICSVGINKNAYSTSYNLGFTNPKVMNRDLSLGIDIFAKDSGEDAQFRLNPFSNKSYGTTVSLGYEAFANLYHNTYYSLKKEKIDIARNKNTTTPDDALKAQTGQFRTSAIGHSLTYDRLDNRIFAKSGYMIKLSQEYAGLGYDNAYLKNELEYRVIWSLSQAQKSIMKFSLSGGKILGLKNQQVRFVDNYYLGDFSFRGFRYNGVGPRIKRMSNENKPVYSDAIGGKNYYKASVELVSPIKYAPREIDLHGLLFFDYGSLWGYDLPKSDTELDFTVENIKQPRYSFGIGAILKTPAGPLQFCIPLFVKQRDGDVKETFHISMATEL